MQRSKIVLLILGLLFPLAAFGQISEEEFLALLVQQDLATVRERANQAYRQHPQSAVAAYLNALLAEDAEEAIKLFQDITTRFRSSLYAERSLFRLGQYHFARGSYMRAREYFLNLTAQYQSSRLAPQAKYYAAKSLLISGKIPQAQEELSDCVQNAPGTWMAKFAAEDLAKLNGAADHKTSKPQPRQIAPYTVQVGSYTQRENAFKQQLIFAKSGYPSEIHEKTEGRKTYYQIWVGEFVDRKQARHFADEMQRKFKLRCHVVKR